MMNKTEIKQVLHALNINRVMAEDSDGNYTREVTPKLITNAIALCEASLARVVEPVDNKPLLMAAINCGHEIEHEKITLYFDNTKPGHNALNQLSIRVNAACATPQAAAQPCQTLCELCIKFGYNFCANAAKTTPLPPTPSTPEKQ